MASPFIQQLRDNPRLRWGLLLILGILWLYGVLLLRDARDVQDQQYRASAQAISRLRAQLSQQDWPQRVEPAKFQAVQLESTLWQAPTTGLAQAALQEALNATLQKARAARIQINVALVDDEAATAPDQSLEAKAGPPADLWKIRAKVNFEFNAETLLSLLKQLEEQEKKVVINALNVRKEPSPFVEMELLAYFQKQAASDTAKAKTGGAP